MGGAIVLNAARQGFDLDAVASFHGSIGALLPIKKPIKAKVLVCHGEADSFIPPEKVASFKEEMKEAGAGFKFVCTLVPSTASAIPHQTKPERSSASMSPITPKPTPNPGKNSRNCFKPFSRNRIPNKVLERRIGEWSVNFS